MLMTQMGFDLSFETVEDSQFVPIRLGECDVCNLVEYLDEIGQCEECRRPEYRNEPLRTSVNGNVRPSSPPSDSTLAQYGMLLEDWWHLFDCQDSKCAVCRSSSAFADEWHTDHDHGVERALGVIVVRGILCAHCNTALGHNRSWTEEPMFVDYLIETPLMIFGDRGELSDADIQRWQVDRQIALLTRHRVGF